ncbi:mechanosensitive ion channel family protein [Candidatus Woesearchaeota archaeon]|nr:mechanosensitive ion channel family protein [Candidatus Woesearchaeota archaeon]
MEMIQGYLAITEILQNSSVGFLVVNKWLHAGLIFLGFFILSKAACWIMHHISPLLTSKTKTSIDDLIVEKIKIPMSWLIILLGIYISLVPLSLPEKVNIVLDDVILSIVVIFVTFIVIKTTDVLIDAWGKDFAVKTRSSIDNALIPLFHKSSKVLFFILGIVALLKVWNFNVTSLLAGIGIAGMVLGLALKDSLANIFGGISIVIDKSLKVGDKVKINTGEQGIIEDIGLRSTKIRGYDNELVIVPNNVLANNVITNFSLPDLSNRVGVKFSVEYGSDVEKTKKVVLRSLQGMKHIVHNPKPQVILTGMADSGLNFVTFVWFTWDKESTIDDRYNVQEEATQRIYEALNKAKIGIPFPTRKVYMEKVKKKR